MYQIDLFAQQDVANVWQEEEKVWKRGLRGDWLDGQVVDLEAGEVTNADSGWDVVCDDDYLQKKAHREYDQQVRRSETA